MIRRATPEDIPSLEAVYAAARAFMAASGNPHQWGTDKPATAQLMADVAAGHLYVEEEDGRVCAAFALVPGEDPTYREIDGAWRDHRPYATIHRVAADGRHPGFFARCVDFCRRQWPHLRVDTHEDNAPMRHVVAGEGFVYCGVIHLADGSPRLAFEWVKREDD